VSGDWHESNYEHPAKVYWLYHMLQNPHDEEKVKAIMDFVLGGDAEKTRFWEEHDWLVSFSRLFQLDEPDILGAFNGLTESERRANAGSIRYWHEMGKKFAEEGKKCPELLLQCHERVSKRIENLTNAGFVFDADCRSKYTEVIRDRGFGELGAVMVAKKGLARPKKW
jgi:hypothetical protein